ncbi:MAG: glycosyltransferase [Vicinamibacterales bacterium]
MKVVHVITDLQTGGAQVMLRQLVPRLQACGVENTIVSLGAISPDFEGLRTMAGLHSLHMRAKVPSVSALVRLRRLLSATRPDVIHTWLYHADLLGGLAVVPPAVAPVIWGLHHTPSPAERFKTTTAAIVRLNAALSSLVPARIVCCAHASKDAHIARGYDSSRMTVICNGFDCDAFTIAPESRASLRQELGLADETPLVALMARFHPQKDHRTFVRAAAQLHRVRPDVHFVLAGGGVDDTNLALRDWISATPCADRFHLLGLRRDMPRLMAAVDLLASAACYGEALPLVLGEAMACGVPCVTTDVGDSARLVSDTGRVVPPGDADAMAGAWASLLKMPPDQRRQLGEQARARIREHFSLSGYVAEHLALYESVR